MEHPELSKEPLFEDIREFYSNKVISQDNEKDSYNLLIDILNWYYILERNNIDIKLTDDKLEILKSIVQEITHPLLKTIIYYTIGKKSQNKQNPIVILEQYEAYFSFLITNNIDTEKDCSIIRILSLAINLILCTKTYSDYKNILAYPLFLSNQQLKKEKTFAVTLPLKTVIDIDSKGRLEENLYRDFMTQYEKLLVTPQFLHNSSAYRLFDEMILCAKRLKDKTLEANLFNRKKEFLFKTLDETILYGMESKLLNELFNMNLTKQERKNVLDKIQLNGEKAIENMKLIPFQLPDQFSKPLEERLNSSKKKIEETHSFLEALICIAFYSTPLTQAEYSKCKIDDENSVANIIATRRTYRGNGFVTNNINTTYSFIQQCRCNELIELIQTLRTYHNPLLVEIYPLLLDNPFVPENFIHSFAIGLYKVIELDLFTASRFLIINSETLIKNIANLQGLITNVQKKDNIIDDKIDFKDIFSDPKFHEAIGEDIALELNLLLYSDEGFKLRHEMAHGMLDDEYSQNATTLLPLWWLWIRILVLGKIKQEKESLQPQLD